MGVRVSVPETPSVFRELNLRALADRLPRHDLDPSFHAVDPARLLSRPTRHPAPNLPFADLSFQCFQQTGESAFAQSYPQWSAQIRFCHSFGTADSCRNSQEKS